jgi:acetyltransferase-like isoleucine patch superfamily enzyme
MNHRGFIAPSVKIWHPDLTVGPQVFMGDRVIIYRNEGGGGVTLGQHVGLGHDVVLETGQGGTIQIGDRSRCQFNCHLAAYKSPILIGNNVGIGQGCAFFSHDHGRSPQEHGQLITKGPIIIDDDAWLGAGVKVLSGVRIGRGAVVAAGSVVTRDVPDGAVAAGVPARVVKMRLEMSGEA